MHEAVLYSKNKDKSVVCTACKLKCHIKENKAGVCGVRINRKGILYLPVYGKASAVNIDPIEKKPLYHFLPGTEIFSIGTIGCNFGCTFCQNWDLSQVARTLRRKLVRDKGVRALELRISKYGYDLPPDNILAICLQRNISSIAYTYNEPVIFFEYLYDILKLSAKEGIKNVFVSNGYETTESLDMLGDELHAMNIDLKAFTDDFYKKKCSARLQPVLDTIVEVYRRDIWLEITTLVIPDENDSEEELRDIAEFISSISPDIPWHISRFHPEFKMKDKPRTSEGKLMKAHEIGKRAGLKHVYIGNLYSPDKSHTYCPSCGEILIKRSGYRTQILKGFRRGKCTQCKTAIAGIWN